MTATVEPTAPRRYRAYCGACGDGRNTTKAAAQAWAAQHNTENHGDPHERRD